VISDANGNSESETKRILMALMAFTREAMYKMVVYSRIQILKY